MTVGLSEEYYTWDHLKDSVTRPLCLFHNALLKILHTLFCGLMETEKQKRKLLCLSRETCKAVSTGCKQSENNI